MSAPVIAHGLAFFWGGSLPFSRLATILWALRIGGINHKIFCETLPSLPKLEIILSNTPIFTP